MLASSRLLSNPYNGESRDEGLRKNLNLDLSDVVIDMAYFADIKHGDPIANNANEEPYRPAKRGALKPYTEGFLERIRALTGDWLDAPVDWLEERTGLLSGFAREILSATLKDMAAYYKDQDTRSQIQQRLIEKLAAYRDHEVILISHSMGTIVAYEVLRQVGSQTEWLGFNLRHFITMGSPLGLTAIKGQILTNENEKLRTPTPVTHSWVNFSDPDDIVAIDSHLRDDYKENSAGVRVDDVLVANDYPGNEHKSYGYLRTPEFSQHLARLI